MSSQGFYKEIRLWPFSRRTKQLTINHDILKYSSSSFLGSTAKIFAKNEIIEFRFGVRWIRGLRFIIGREYQIIVRDQNRDEIAIYFKTLYGYRGRQLRQQYHDIIQALWDFFFWNMIKLYRDKFLAGNDFELCGVCFSKQGLTINVSGIIKETKKLIVWDKLGTHAYASYFAIYSLDDASNINHGYNYHQDWNAFVLKALVESILDYKKSTVKNN